MGSFQSIKWTLLILSTKTSVSLLVSDLSEPLENQLQKKIKMNGKFLSGFLCVLLIATFQVENSEAFQPGRVKRSLEVREEISWIHSQITYYQANGTSRVMDISFFNPCLRALKSTIFEPNFFKKNYFQEIEHGIVLIFVLYKSTISYLCFRLYIGYMHFAWICLEL